LLVVVVVGKVTSTAAVAVVVDIVLAHCQSMQGLVSQSQ
jgi:hypothetical protein